MSPISSGIAAARRAHRLDVRQNGGLFAEPGTLAGQQLQRTSANSPRISQAPFRCPSGEETC
jgi:hypothetical protein